jgi:peptidoglycan/LPS O-acetylase OafA/YrhL
MTTDLPRPAPAAVPGRRHDLDWVRILAFAVLIAYHSGMYYVDWDWHIKSPHASAGVGVFMMLTAPWRLGLLFFVSGCATAFFVRRLGRVDAASPSTPSRARQLLRERSQRLLIPLAIGVWFIVPPQSYWEVVEKIAYPGTYLDFWARYAQGDTGFCRDGSCLRLPTWNHLWFVAYLWVYAALLAAGLAVAPRALSRLRAWLASHVKGVAAIAVPAAVLAGLRLALVEHWPQTHALVDDLYSHSQYLFLFALGLALAEADAFWQTLRRARWALLAAAVLAWAVLVVYFAHYAGPDVAPPQALRLAMRALYGAQQWLAPAAALGFARAWNPGDSPARRYLTEAVFPFYIVHQTAIILIAEALKPLALPVGLEALALVAGTVASCFAAFEIVRRVGWLRPLFGLAPRRTGAGGAAAARPGLPRAATREGGAIIPG